MMKLLFVGDSWLGSCSRTLKEALARRSDIVLDEVNSDLLLPNPRTRWLRAINRFLLPQYTQELYDAIAYRIGVFRPDVVMTHKGPAISAEFISRMRGMGTTIVCVYPDCSPHAHGELHKAAVGQYDLVISTKPFHPRLWKQLYGYSNRCEFVPQGYDPLLHLHPELPAQTQFDVAMVATYRKEHGELIEELHARLADFGIRFGIGGFGWKNFAKAFPTDWVFPGELHGRSYAEWLRRAKICIAPLARSAVVDGASYPGDEDTTRTYELAAANCFFIHRRTDYLKDVYDEAREVPMYDSAEELAEKIRYYLPRPVEQRKHAEAAFRRAVPEYSMDSRVDQIVGRLNALLNR